MYLSAFCRMELERIEDAVERVNQRHQRYDVLLSHASEDKETVARPRVRALKHAGLSVWFDEAALAMGDSLRQKIEDR